MLMKKYCNVWDKKHNSMLPQKKINKRMGENVLCITCESQTKTEIQLFLSLKQLKSCNKNSVFSAIVGLKISSFLLKR